MSDYFPVLLIKVFVHVSRVFAVAAALYGAWGPACFVLIISLWFKELQRDAEENYYLKMKGLDR